MVKTEYNKAGIFQQISIVITTTQTMEAARRLARELVEGRLVACIQLSRITSIYSWEGNIEEEEEVRLMCKVAPPRLDEVRAYLKQNHPYETPEIISQEFDAEATYAEWCYKVSGL